MRSRKLGQLDPDATLHDDKGALREQEQRVKAAQKGSGGSANSELRERVDSFEREVVGIIRAAVDEMQTARDGETMRGGLFARYWREEQKYRNEEQADVDDDGVLCPDGEYSHLKAGVSTGLFTDNVNTVAAWLVQSVLGNGGRSYQIKPKGRKDENDAKTRVVTELIDTMLHDAGMRARVAEAFADLPKHGTCALRQSWVEETSWVRNDARVWEERIMKRGPSFEWWRLIDLFVSNPLSIRADEQDAVVWYSRSTLSRLQRNERVWEVAEKTVSDPATGGWLEIKQPYARGRFVNLERLRRGVANAAQSSFREQAMDTTGPTGTSAEENRDYQVSAEDLYQLYEFQGYFPMGALYRRGILTDAVLDHYGVRMDVAGLEDEDGQPTAPTGEALARLLDGIMWYVSFVEGEGANGAGMLVEMRPCPYREARNELISGYFIQAGHEFYGMSSDKLAGDVGDSADQVLNDITAIISNNADPNTAIFKYALADDNGKAVSDDKLRDLLNGTGNIIPFNNQPVPVGQMVQYMLKPYDASMKDIFNTLGEIYNKRTLSSNLAQGGAAQTESDTLGEAQSQLREIERRMADVAVRLSGEQIVQPIVVNVIKDLDWFYTAEELADLAKTVCGQKGLDFDTIFPTAAAEGGTARRALADDFVIEGTAAAEIQKEVAIQFLLKMGEAAQALPTADLEANFKACYDLMGFDPEKFFKKTSGPLPARKVVEMILAGDKPNVDPQMDAMGTIQELQMNRVAWGKIKDELETAGHSTEAWDGFIKVLDSYIMDVGDLAKAQMQIKMQMMQQQAQQMQQAQRARGGAKPQNGAGQGGAGNQPPQGPAGVMQGIQRGAGSMAAQPPAGTMGARS